MRTDATKLSQSVSFCAKKKPDCAAICACRNIVMVKNASIKKDFIFVVRQSWPICDYDDGLTTVCQASSFTH